MELLSILSLPSTAMYSREPVTPFSSSRQRKPALNCTSSSLDGLRQTWCKRHRRACKVFYKIAARKGLPALNEVRTARAKSSLTDSRAPLCRNQRYRRCTAKTFGKPLYILFGVQHAGRIGEQLRPLYMKRCQVAGDKISFGIC